MLTFKVSSQSEVGSIGAAVADVVSKSDEVALISVGAAATYQSLKGVIRAGEFLKKEKITLVIEPTYQTIMFEEGPKSAVQLLVYDKKCRKNFQKVG